jgi:hypothetical protein
MKLYTVTFTTVIRSNTPENAAQEVADGLKNNAYKNVELIVESENERPVFVEVHI